MITDVVKMVFTGYRQSMNKTVEEGMYNVEDHLEQEDWTHLQVLMASRMKMKNPWCQEQACRPRRLGKNLLLNIVQISSLLWTGWH